MLPGIVGHGARAKPSNFTLPKETTSMSKLTWEDLQIPATFKRELAKYNAKAKRRWCTVKHETRVCRDGPFDGQPLALSEAQTAVFVVGKFRGRYRSYSVDSWIWEEIAA